MKSPRNILNDLYKSGVKPALDDIQKKEIILSNKISLVLLPLSGIGIAMSYIGGLDNTLLGFILFTGFLISVFVLNHLGFTFFTRLGLSVLPLFFLLIPNLISPQGHAENYISFGYTFIGLVVIPLLLFQHKNGQAFLKMCLLINLLLVVFYDVLILRFSQNTFDVSLLEQNYIYFKIPQIFLWIVVVMGIQFLKRENLNYEEKLLAINDRLHGTNKEIHARNEEISIQNEALKESQVKLEKQQHIIENKNNELNNTKLELLKTIDKLKEAKDQYFDKEAEANSIIEALNEHYLVAQYDLEGKLVNINTKVIELLGVLRNEYFEDIKSFISSHEDKADHNEDGVDVKAIWKNVLLGKAQTINLEYSVGKDKKYMAATFAPLFNQKGEPYKVLTIGQDISELVEKNEEIDKINKDIKDKIVEISQQNELLNFQQHEIFEKSEELHRQKEEIQAINESLEIRVQERTKVLEEQNKQLAEYAFINSHVLRSPISTMMGLINLMSYSSLPKEDQKIYNHLKTTAVVLDNVVFKINDALEKRVHFNREFLEPERKFRPMHHKAQG